MAFVQIWKPAGFGRVGFNRVVRKVRDTALDNDDGFEGYDLADGETEEVEAGALVVQLRPINALVNEYRAGIVQEDGEIKWGPTFDSGYFGYFVRQVRELLRATQGDVVSVVGQFLRAWSDCGNKSVPEEIDFKVWLSLQPYEVRLAFGQLKVQEG